MVQCFNEITDPLTVPKPNDKRQPISWELCLFDPSDICFPWDWKSFLNTGPISTPTRFGFNRRKTFFHIMPGKLRFEPLSAHQAAHIWPRAYNRITSVYSREKHTCQDWRLFNESFFPTMPGNLRSRLYFAIFISIWSWPWYRKKLLTVLGCGHINWYIDMEVPFCCRYKISLSIC